MKWDCCECHWRKVHRIHPKLLSIHCAIRYSIFVILIKSIEQCRSSSRLLKLLITLLLLQQNSQKSVLYSAFRVSIHGVLACFYLWEGLLMLILVFVQLLFYLICFVYRYKWTCSRYQNSWSSYEVPYYFFWSSGSWLHFWKSKDQIQFP